MSRNQVTAGRNDNRINVKLELFGVTREVKTRKGKPGKRNIRIVAALSAR